MIQQMQDVWFAQQEEIFLKGIFPSDRKSIVFSHNDLLANNILVKTPESGEDEQEICFIDFQYASYNYRGFDIGNYFNESAIDYNYGKPPFFREIQTEVSQEVVKDFILFYALTSLITDEKTEDKIDFRLLQEDQAYL